MASKDKPIPDDTAKKPPISNTNATLFKMAAVAAVMSMIAYLISSGRHESYALCTPDGKGIYTVDGNNSLVECILVRQGHIVDSGDLGNVTPFSDI